MPSVPRAQLLCAFIMMLSSAAGCLPRSGTPLSRSAASPAGSADLHATEVGDNLGVLVMAHGGGEEWNNRVSQAVAGLGDRIPLAVAFGMANRPTLQAALDSLHARAVGTVAVVRLFISGASFLHQTEYLFGVRPDAPARVMMGDRMVNGSDLRPLGTDARILLDPAGMAGSEHASRILLGRADATSPHPSQTGVLLLAHGMGAEDANDRLLDDMQGTARRLRSTGYGEVRVATLREDWAAARKTAAAEIRAIVSDMSERWRQAVVVPYRIHGRGPYAEVLDGLDYVATEGLLPHRLVGEWIAGRAAATFCTAGLASPLGPCPGIPSTQLLSPVRCAICSGTLVP